MESCHDWADHMRGPWHQKGPWKSLGSSPVSPEAGSSSIQEKPSLLLLVCASGERENNISDNMGFWREKKTAEHAEEKEYTWREPWRSWSACVGCILPWSPLESSPRCGFGHKSLGLRILIQKMDSFS